MISTRIPGLDGLRAFAVVSVMLFHADYPQARGGFLGVDLFFVISGFLITRLLLDAIDREGTVCFASFYERRLRRILPAMLTVIACTMLACFYLRPEALPALRVDATAALFLIANWHFQLQGVSYFEKFQGLQMLQHLWSLAVEEQFYAFWPLVVLAIARPWGRRGLGLFAGSLALASALWMGWLAQASGFPESMDIDRIYLGTDTHAFGLLIGAVLACGEKQLSSLVIKQQSPALATAATSLGLALLAGLLAAFALIGENHSLLYPGGFLVASLLAAGIIVSCIISPTIGQWLDSWPLRWIGERSYGLYLWHWPVFILTRPGLDVELSQHESFCLRLLITVALAAITYRFIEAPMRARPADSPSRFRQGLAAAALGGSLAVCASVYLIPSLIEQHRDPLALNADETYLALHDWRQEQLQMRLRSYDLGRWQGPVPSVAESKADPAIREPDGPGHSLRPSTSDWSGFLAHAIASRIDLGIKGGVAEPVWRGQDFTKPQFSTDPSFSPSLPDKPDERPEPEPPRAVRPPVALPPRAVLPPAALPKAAPVTSMSVFGDSVVLGARLLLEQGDRPASVYAEVGWQASDILKHIRQVREAGELQPLVVLHLGTNGYVSEKQLRSILDLLWDRQRILLVNTRVPKRWMTANNALFESVIASYTHVELIDWFALADHRSDFFVSDGVHLSAAGMRAFVDAISLKRQMAQAAIEHDRR